MHITQEFISYKGVSYYFDFEYKIPMQGVWVLVNGLSNTTSSWDQFVPFLRKIFPSYGILRVDLRGQGKTLKKEGVICSDISYTSQAEALSFIINQLSINVPLYGIGLSYGSAVVMATQKIIKTPFDELFLLAPYVAPQPGPQNTIDEMTSFSRMLNPFVPKRVWEEMYLRTAVYAWHPYFEGGIPNPIETEALYRMIKGVQEFQLASYLKADNTHWILAGRDEYLPIKQVLSKIQTHKNSHTHTYSILNTAKHRIPETHPKDLAALIYMLKSHPSGTSTLKGKLHYY